MAHIRSYTGIEKQFDKYATLLTKETDIVKSVKAFDDDFLVNSARFRVESEGTKTEQFDSNSTEEEVVIKASRMNEALISGKDTYSKVHSPYLTKTTRSSSDNSDE